MRIKRELWFGLSLMAVILAITVIFMPWGNMTNGHLGLLMLSLVVVAIMLGFPTAFTLMGMGVFFAWLAYRSSNPELATTQTLDLMVQRAFSVMSNDVLISIPLFVFMGYLVERANLIAKLFRSLELSLARLPGALAVATLVTCAIFATATGIVGAVVTLMGLLAFPAMLRSGYDVRLSAGAITAGGCLGILIPPSVMLIVYGATAGVSVVKLYAGAFFPGLMLAGLYILYVIIVAKLKPHLAPPLPMAERYVELPAEAKVLNDRLSHRALPALARAIGGKIPGVGRGYALREMVLTLLPALALIAMLAGTWHLATRPAQVDDVQGLVAMGEQLGESAESAGGLAEPPSEEDAKEAPADGLKEPLGAAPVASTAGESGAGDAAERSQTPDWFFGVALGALVGAAIFYTLLSFVRLEIFKMLLSSFFPLAIMILAVLGSIVFGLATPTEAAAVGALGGFVLAAAYRQLTLNVVKESVFLTAKTSAMVCWLFVGSSIFSAAFALLGGQALVEQWVLSMDLTPFSSCCSPRRSSSFSAGRWSGPRSSSSSCRSSSPCLRTSTSIRCSSACSSRSTCRLPSSARRSRWLRST